MCEPVCSSQLCTAGRKPRWRYDWGSFFDDHTIKTALKGITKMHHFCFTNTHPGQTFVKNRSCDVERLITIRKGNWQAAPDELLQLIRPQGLLLKRRWYLFDKIRDFCPDVQDMFVLCQIKPYIHEQQCNLYFISYTNIIHNTILHANNKINIYRITNCY